MKVHFPETYVVWDLETTGLDTQKCEIVEFAALMVKNRQVVGEYSAIINNNCDIPTDASDIHGITTEIATKEGQELWPVLNKVLRIFKEYPNHLTHNGVRFDIPLLLSVLSRTGKLTTDQYRAIETHLIKGAIDTAAIIKGDKADIKRMWNEDFFVYAERVLSQPIKGIKYNVGFICEELGIDKSKVQQHRAGGDVVLTNEIYKRVCLTK